MSLSVKGLYPLRGGRRLSVVLSDNRRISLTHSKVRSLGLEVGQEAPPALLVLLEERFSPECARNTASRLGMMRPIFSFELEKKLLEKGFSADVTRDTLDWMYRMGALNDRETLRLFISAGEANGKGRKMLLQELVRRGMDRHEAGEALAEQEENDSGILTLLSRRLKGSTDKDDLRKAVSYLYRRGYDRERVSSLLHQYLQNRNEDSQ